MLNSYPNLIFEVIKRVDSSTYANVKYTRLINLGPIALFKSFKMETNSGKHLEDTSLVQLVSLLNKLTTSAKDSDDFFFGFHEYREQRKDELALKKSIKSK